MEITKEGSDVSEGSDQTDDKKTRGKRGKAKKIGKSDEEYQPSDGSGHSG